MIWVQRVLTKSSEWVNREMRVSREVRSNRKVELLALRELELLRD